MSRFTRRAVLGGGGETGRPPRTRGLGGRAMQHAPDNPLIVQGDHTLLLETASPRYEEARDALLGFAELVKSPEYIHTWRITSLSLWNAASRLMTSSPRCAWSSRTPLGTPDSPSWLTSAAK